MLTSIRGLLAATLVVGCGLAATPAFADETDPPSDITVTGNVTLVSDYRFRGLSLSGGDMAIQGAINVNHKSGIYAGAWASSLEDSPVYGNMELDIYAGWTGSVGGGVTADVGLLYYVYPNGYVGDANVFEPYASVSTTFGPASAKVGVAYAWKQDSLGGDDNLYLYTDWGLGVPNTPISIAAHLGYTDGALSPKLLTGAGTGGGFDYSVGATYAITKNLSAGVSYVGVDGNSIDGFSNDAVVGTLKLAF
ncbi:MAG: TorF family putative porin [Novosphingobium sp.]